FNEVDRFRGVAVGFRPRLRDFIDHPGREFMLALTHQGGRAKQQRNALSCGNIAPCLESLSGGLDSFGGEFLRRLVKLADDLRPVCWVDAVKNVAGIDAFAANHQRVLASELALNFFERGAHGRSIFFLLEISKWFVTKFCWHDLICLCVSVGSLSL